MAPSPRSRAAIHLLLFALALAPAAAAQTIDGTLMDVDTDAPIPFGLVMMYSEAGDSITATVTDAAGRFRLTAPEPGSFVLLAAALGYRETPAGVFELGRGGALNVEYRLPPEPLPIDEIVVALGRTTLQHSLVRNGFVRRLQRGTGVFVTPHDIEESAATSTEMLLGGIAGVTVAPLFIQEGGIVMPRPDVGEHVRMRGRTGDWCYPTVFLDGMRVPYDVERGQTLSSFIDLQSVDGIEVYRRPTEVPIEYASGISDCGVLVFWSRMGPVRGERVADLAALGIELPPGSEGRLPTVDVDGPAPVEGERVRLELDEEARAATGLGSPWEGTFLAAREGDLIGRDPTFGRAVAIPLDGVDELHVRRVRPPIYAVRRGAFAGAIFGTGMWLHLNTLCRDACDGVADSSWLPASLSALLFGALFAAQGPGEHWVRAPLPLAGPSPRLPGAPGPAGPSRLDLGLRMPLGGR